MDFTRKYFAPGWLCALFALLLAACAPTLAPQGTASVTPAIEQEFFLTRDGVRLPLRQWKAENPKAVILALHGMSDYSMAFDMPGPWWAEQGITTYAYDQRGFGAGPNPGLWAGSDVMRADLSDAVDALKQKHPGVPVFILGESMGGAVVLSALASQAPPRADGAILVAPAVWSRGDMPLAYRAALWFAAHFLPGMNVSGSGLQIWPSDNIEMLRRNGRDPLFQKKARADAIYGLVNLMDEARKAPSHLNGRQPLLLLHGANDQVIPAEPTRAVIAELGTKADIRDYPKGFHMLLRDLQGPTVWKDVADWIATRR